MNIINLLEYFETTVNHNADKIAVRHNDTKIDFKELKNYSMKLGTYLSAMFKDSVNIPIAVFLPKEINIVIADLGIMYSSNHFVNLDVKTPIERINNILKTVKPMVIVTSSAYVANLTGLSIPLVIIDEIELHNVIIDDEVLLKKRSRLIDTDPFCIINTSGSTGTPKGVVLNHRSFIDFMNASGELFNFDGSEIIGSLSPVVFDIFEFELCMMMRNASELILLDAFLAAFPARLLECLVKNNVNFIFWVPSIMVNIANLGLLDKMELPNLRLVWFAGEVFPTKQFTMWYDKLPAAVFVNLYGPIEITLDCTYYIVKERPDENEPLPIGIPYKNTDIMILNDNNNICHIGEEGELCVRGSSLAMGYYNNLEKTMSSFVQNPLNTMYPELIYRTGDIAYLREDGNIIFKGRKDSLIKHMGYRIELGEIEHVVENDLKLVDYCCAVYNSEKREIVLFYENQDELSVGDFRKNIGRRLPSYMIPTEYIKLDVLPRNTNGKIDRLLLKDKINNM
ncbi:MAG: amino acid adenylation domain-containing protein [Lachnospiraceae bacterium]|nr:amino acid adenylation domain-containing protein [Lachnospiraceae bacterium]